MAFPVSQNLKKALDIASNYAIKYSNPELGSEHLLAGLLAVEGTAVSKIIKETGITLEVLEELFAESEHAAIIGGVELSVRVKRTLMSAQQLCQMQGLSFIDSEQVFYCMLSDKTSRAIYLLMEMHVDFGAIVKKLENIMGGKSEETSGGAAELPSQLAELGIDVTKKAREHKIDPIIGRKEEIERIIQILCRKTKNNPVLIGEPGVGKSAVVEGLSKAIADGNVPELLKDKIVFSLDISSIMAGTKYRGALEEKLKGAIDIITNQKNIIVFIDELHTLAQAGSKEGEVSPADILKPYLARGEMQTIGATTTDEYRKFIETDKALERRFQPIIVAPPSVDETIEILRGLRDNYEAFHKVKISDEALVAAAKLSDRYIADRFLPDKAIDLIDEAMSKAKVAGNTVPPNLKAMEEEVKAIELKKLEATKHEDYDEAAKYRDQKAAVLKKIEELKLEWGKAADKNTAVISPEHIAEIVAKWTKIPVTRLNETETQRLVHLEDQLHRRVIGQDEAVVSVARAIRRARAGLKDPNRPIGSFLFLGPTGVGKTELTKALSEAMFDDDNAVIRLDMSEYMEAHSVSKLIGAPPGYVGHDEGGQLTEQVRRKPYSVVLFDEIEKAHPDVYNALLQILDDGRLTDSQGRMVSFKNTIIIMTSNVGVGDLKNTPRSLGFSSKPAAEIQKTNEILSEALKRTFKPEFLNRIDVVSIFHSLSKEDIRKIAAIMINKVKKTLLEKGIKLELTDNAYNFIIERGYDVEYGARPLRRVIEQSIEDNLAEGILSGEIKENSSVTVDVVNGQVKFC